MTLIAPIRRARDEMDRPHTHPVAKNKNRQEELAAAKRAAEEAEAQLAEARAAAAEAVSTQSQLQVRVTLAERRVEALEGEKRVLKADRDFTMAMLEEKQQAQQARAQEEQTAKQDVEAQLASACKDNAVLLQRLKETAGEADEMAARRAAVEARAQVRCGGCFCWGGRYVC